MNKSDSRTTIPFLPVDERRSRRGFSLLELLGVLIILAVIAAVIVPVFTGERTRVDENDALSRAQILDLAKLTFLRRKEPEAQKSWDEAKEDQVRYEMLQPYLVQPPPLLGDGKLKDAFAPIGYYYILNKLQQPTTLIRLSDSKVLTGPSDSQEDK